MRPQHLAFLIQLLILISLFFHHEVTGLTFCGSRRRTNLIELNPGRKTNVFWRQYNRFDTPSTLYSNDQRYEGTLGVSEALNSKALISTLQSMFVISGPLGMLLDNQHGLFGVLKYDDIGKPISLALGDHEILRSALWVPFLFAFAGFAMSLIVLTLDKVLKTSDKYTNPSWPKTFYGISFFSAQYYLSGLLDNQGVDVTSINIFLAALSVFGFAIFDTSLAGLLLGIATAIAGPLTEIVLVNVPHLYIYTHADFYGVCSWIPWVYLLGAPAVGNLARKLYRKACTTNTAS